MDVARPAPGEDLVGRYYPFGVVGHKGQDSAEGGETPALVDIDMAVGSEDGPIPAGAVGKKGGDVALGPGGHEKGRLVSCHTGRFFF